MCPVEGHVAVVQPSILQSKCGPQQCSGVCRILPAGSLRSCDPDRIVLKKVVLSGYPVKVQKKKAVVRWMFHSPEDIRWFRPVDLWTKHGRRGQITVRAQPRSGSGCSCIVYALQLHQSHARSPWKAMPSIHCHTNHAPYKQCCSRRHLRSWLSCSMESDPICSHAISWLCRSRWAPMDP